MKKTCILCPAYFEGSRAENICPKCLLKEYKKQKDDKKQQETSPKHKETLR